jgi:hypothetical protein
LTRMPRRNLSPRWPTLKLGACTAASNLIGQQIRFVPPHTSLLAASEPPAHWHTGTLRQ